MAWFFLPAVPINDNQHMAAVSRFHELMFRSTAEADPLFVAEIQRVSRRGLITIGWVEIGLTAASILTRLAGIPYPHEGKINPLTILMFVSLGLISFTAARVSMLAPHSRAIALIIGGATAVVTTAADLSAIQSGLSAPVALDMVTIWLVALATVPATPVQVAGLGAFTVFSHLAIVAGFANAGWISGYQPATAAVLVLGGLCTALAGVNYSRMYLSYRAHRDTLEASESSRHLELRACHAENAAAMLRLAATISHEMNTPLGALRSSVDTTVRIAERLPSVPVEQQRRQSELLAQMAVVIRESSGRLDSIVKRMQRFTNLDRAEVQEIDMTKLIEDVIELYCPRQECGVRLEVDLSPMPKFLGQPQALSGIFSTILNRAVDEARPEGTVRVEASVVSEELRVTVHQKGSESTTSFDPDFEEQDGRIAASNWDLFGARQVVLAQGGEITVETGAGSTVLLTLPVQTAHSSAA